MTNADNIRKMNDRELAEFLCESVSSDVCGTQCPWFSECNGDPYSLLSWLKTEVKER